MKYLNTYIVEKLHLNKDTKVNQYYRYMVIYSPYSKRNDDFICMCFDTIKEARKKTNEIGSYSMCIRFPEGTDINKLTDEYKKSKSYYDFKEYCSIVDCEEVGVYDESIKEELEDVIVKVGDWWRIRGHAGKGTNTEKRGYWKAKYKTKTDAENALKAYFANKG